MANFKYATDNRFILNIDDNLLYDKKDSLTSNKIIQFQNNAKRVLGIKLEIRKKCKFLIINIVICTGQCNDKIKKKGATPSSAPLDTV